MEQRRKSAYLTKSRYIDGLRCSRKLWLGWHEPLSHDDPEPFSILDIGNQIGAKAHLLFPDGVLVKEKAYQHQEAIERTRDLINNPSIPAIFEAAFDHENVRVRVDILERLGNGTWGLREVKSTGSVRDDRGHYDDVAVQLHVVEGSGLEVSSVELIHVNGNYVRGEHEIDWFSFFNRADLTEVARKRLSDVRTKVPLMQNVLAEQNVPEVLISRALCTRPYRCDYIDRCIADKPGDWVGYLPRIGGNLQKLHSQGIESIRSIPELFELSGTLQNIRQSFISDEVMVKPDLARALSAFGPPAYYLDFETIGPSIPFYPHTSPYEQVPFQWSLHMVDRDGTISHQEFLADGCEDPRRQLAESLIEAVSVSKIPIVAWSKSTEVGILKRLGEKYNDLKAALDIIRERVVDLLPVVSANVIHPKFFNRRSLDSSPYSIKNVLPVLVEGEDYKNLEGVSSGLDASLDFVRIINGVFTRQEEQSLREGLLEYCKQDTQAMIDVQHAIVRLAKPSQ